jgi:hypothetical protein
MPAGRTYEAIATTVLQAAGTSVNFTSIPSNFTDLVAILNVRGDAVNTNTMLRFNSDTATNYSLTGMSGEGASPISYRNTSVAQIALNSGSANWNNVWGNLIVHIMNYSNTTTTKTVISRGNAATGETELHIGLWRKSPVEAINALNFVATSGSWSSGSTFSLYGIRAA